jgi:AraC-like DNA-binding protein
MDTTDFLSSELRHLRFKATVILNSNYSGSWAIDTSGSGRCTFHIVVDGSCYLYMPEQTQLTPLAKGDLLIFPHDSKHTITDNADFNLSGSDNENCDVGKNAALICGYFDFDDPHRNPIINALPKTVLVKSKNSSIEPRLQVLIDLMKSESAESSTGSDVVVDKLSEILFIYGVRSYVNNLNPSSGILAALTDTQISNALNAIHEKPQESWTVEKLASVAGLSRAAFAKHFSELMGQPPMNYVGEWRMRIAHNALTEGTKGILAIAESVGYHNEVAFRKAFKKITGVTPGAARKQHELTI